MKQANTYLFSKTGFFSNYTLEADFENPIIEPNGAGVKIDGWTHYSPSTTLSVEPHNGSDWLKVVSTNGTHGAHQGFSVEPGETYTFEIDLHRPAGMNKEINVVIWKSSGPSGALSVHVLNVDGTNTFTYTATSSNIYIQIRQAGTYYLDNIRMYRTYEDTVFVGGFDVDRAYRYGFNSMERDNEIKGKGNSYDFGARMYDSRLGRWLSGDPHKKSYPHLTPYSFVGNMVTVANDPDGKDIIFTVNKSEDGKLIVTAKINAKLVNESSEEISSEQMEIYAQRMAQGLEDYWGANKGYLSDVYDEEGNIVSGFYDMINVEVDITVASDKNPINSDDHVIRIRDKGRIPELTDEGSQYAPQTVEGYAPEGKNVVYITKNVLDRLPTKEGEYGGRGLTSEGESSLERTISHEFGHSAGLVYGTLGHHTVYLDNLLRPSNQKDAGTKLAPNQIEHMIKENTKMNDGQQNVQEPQ